MSPRQVFCIIGDSYRSTEVADDVASGRFDLAGIELDLGLSPDWNSALLPEDEEWRIEWSKFYYGLHLAHAFGVSGEQRYRSVWEDLVLSWIDQVQVDADSTDVIARRVQNWIYAWNRFDLAGSPLDDPVAATIQESICSQLAVLRSNLSVERNHRTLELYALFIGSAAMPDAYGSPELLEFSIHELYRNLCVDVLDDGVQRELSTHYHAIVLRSFVGFLVNAERLQIEVTADFSSRVEAACDFLAHVTRPDGSLPMLSDSDDGDYSDLLLVAAGLFDRDDLLHVATRGKQGSPPSSRIRHFDRGGYFVQRSGWGTADEHFEDQRHLVLDCGQVGASGHGHYDALHVEVSAGGAGLLIDPGRFTYSEHGDVNWRKWFKGTAAHNTVSVDGLDQTPYRRGKPKGPLAHARLLRCDEGARVSSVTAEVVSPSYDAVHRRTVMFVDSQFWVIVDDLTAHETHNYELRWHLAPGAKDRTTVHGQGVDAPGVRLAFESGSELLVDLEQGWIAPRYGVREPAPVVNVSATGADVNFVTVIVPAEPGDVCPEVTRVSANALRVSLAGSGGHLSWAGSSASWEVDS